ncbi:hypothetical protein THRCLA_04019 [Thraustotheca clavata]|uniref:Transmembrane protein n=1 Tax=Thraustotheca clavata TaxID=74557 RepID=A0A1W0A0E7_9STRA|nr:hypothetical protein THRCLA_04019 [Thraustotheca clavata]
MKELLDKVTPNAVNSSPNPEKLPRNAQRKPRYGHGMVLSLLYMGFATAVAITTYYLNSIANVPTFFGLLTRTFSTPWIVPITTLLQGASIVPNATLTLNNSFALSNLLYKACTTNNKPCADGFVPESNLIWSKVGQTFAAIPNFDQPLFQDPNQIIKFKHISNLNGWNKAAIQYYIDGFDVAMTCQIRRTKYVVGTAPAIVDTLAYCSQRTYDPEWICENEVDLDVNTYAIQMQKGNAVYLGVVKRGQIYFNPGHTALMTGGQLGNVTLQTVRSVNMYEYDMIQESGVWDILTVSDCKNLNFKNNWGWLLQVRGLITITWQCQSLMLTNSIVLFFMTIYLVILQFTFLHRSTVCCVPVYMSKNVVGLVILFIVFYGNHNVQALTTYLLLNPTYNQTWYALYGPIQVASIVGIMTGTIIQIWFNPQVVTQTWKDTYFPIETFCGPFRVMLQYQQIVMLSFVIMIIGIMFIYIDEYWFKDKTNIPESNTALQYLNVKDFSSVATSTKRCLVLNDRGELAVDSGILLSKNMIQISRNIMTRTCNIQYEVIYRFVPKFLQKYYSQVVGSMLAIQLEEDKITDKGLYLYLYEMGIGGRNQLSGYFS